jgi:hypothetical protein
VRHDHASRGLSDAPLGVSEATILRDWRAARAWLAAALQRDR